MVWTNRLPTETKLCCKMLGRAMVPMRRSASKEKVGAGVPAKMCSRRRSTTHESAAETPWAISVAQATPGTPQSKRMTKIRSSTIFPTDEPMRNSSGVRLSPRAVNTALVLLYKNRNTSPSE